MSYSMFPIDRNYLDMTQYLLEHIYSKPYQDLSLPELQEQLDLCNYTHGTLENLERLYKENMDDLLGGVYDTEKQIRKKWHKEDKIAMGISMGMIYPVLRKFHKQDKKENNAQLNLLKDEYHVIESYHKEITHLREQMADVYYKLGEEIGKRHKSKSKKEKKSEFVKV